MAATRKTVRREPAALTSVADRANDPGAEASVEPDWDVVRRETLAHLQALLRFDTTNPPGNEIVAARYLEAVLTAAGIETTLLQPAPGRAALVARLRGSGERGPVMVMAHMDVVGVEREHWSTDPFGAETREGFLYGRGAIDDKGMLAANLETMLLLKRHIVDAGEALARDVLFVATSDEEAGGDWGMGWIIDHHPELVRAEIALNEGGRTRIVDGTPLYVAVQSAEKVAHVLTLTAHGPGGHAAVPLAGNAVFRLGRALAAIGAHREPVKLTPTTRMFFGELARVWPDKRERQAMRDLTSGERLRVERGAKTLSSIPVFDAVLRNGISAVMTGGGIRHNVIPTEVTATLNVRTLPGESIDKVVARLKKAVRDPLVTIEITERGEDAPVSDHRGPMFAAIVESVRALNPAMAVVPYMSTGATDSARLRRLGVQAYGVLPFPLTQEDEDRMHGNDERIPLDSLHFGTRLIFDAVRRVAT